MISALKLNCNLKLAGEWTLNEPAHVNFLADYTGQTRAENAIPIKDLLLNSTVVTLSSDFDVAEINPFKGIHHAVTRNFQNVTMKDAVTMYTYNGAYAMRQDGKVGSIKVGHEADFIIVDQDIFNLADVNDVADTKVKLTVVKGKEVWRKNPF